MASATAKKLSKARLHQGRIDGSGGVRVRGPYEVGDAELSLVWRAEEGQGFFMAHRRRVEIGRHQYRRALCQALPAGAAWTSVLAYAQTRRRRWAKPICEHRRSQLKLGEMCRPRPRAAEALGLDRGRVASAYDNQARAHRHAKQAWRSILPLKTAVEVGHRKPLPINGGLLAVFPKE